MPANHIPSETARAPIGATLEVVTSEHGRLIVHQSGHATSPRAELVCFASLGRESSDFNELAHAVSGAGYAVSLVEGPFLNGAVPRVETPSLFDLADDVAVYLRTRPAPVFVLGHAFGNRLARAIAARHPELVQGVILIAAGGLKPIGRAAGRALLSCFDPEIDASAHEAAVRYGFFADANPVPDYWLRGWHPRTAQIQRHATQSVDSREWWAASEKPMLVIAALQDRIAPPEDTIDRLEADFPESVTGVRIDQAGHALLPEQPEQIAAAMLDWLDRQIGEQAASKL